MNLIDEIVHANNNFLMSNKQGLEKSPSKPSRHILIVTCIDCRLLDLLEPAMGIVRGEANIIKTAGNYIAPGINDTVKSILVAIYELGVKEIVIMGHYNCGVAGATKNSMIEKMIDNNINLDIINEYKNEFGDWINAYTDPKENVIISVNNLRNNYLIPKNIPIHGMIIDPDKANIDIVIDGYSKINK